MTIALAIKINDGLVLAADSATTISIQQDGCSFPHVYNVFNNGEKITNLHRNLPTGLMTWGLASINGHSINWHAKELRQRFESITESHPQWQLDPSSYQMQQVALFVFEYFSSVLDEAGITQPFAFGLLVAGYSSGAGEPEVYTLETVNSVLEMPILRLAKDQAGSIWFGQPEAITRLIRGVSPNIGNALENLGVDPTLIPQYVSRIMEQTNNQVIANDMPIQDAIDLAQFLVDTTIKFTRFSSGPNTVGGPIDVAAITRHEGFKWVDRKHFYPLEFNPREAQIV